MNLKVILELFGLDRLVSGENRLLILVIVLTVFSVMPLHFSGFIFALPAPMRLFLDFGFKVSLSSNAIAIGIFSGFLARYIPVILIGMLGFFHGSSIEKKYSRRGYRRAYVAYVDNIRNDERLADKEAITRHFARLKKFGRNEARLANLKTKDFDKRYRLKFYFDRRLAVTAFLSVFIFSFIYVGALGSALVLLLSGFVWFGFFMYDMISSAHIFRLEKQFWNSSSDNSEGWTIDWSEVYRVVAVVAVVSFTTGFLRVGYLSSERFLVSSTGDSMPYSLIARTHSGMILRYKGNSRTTFQPWEMLSGASPHSTP